MATNVTLINAFNGGTSGVTVLPANSGNPSGAPWDVTTVSTGATLAYDTTHAAQGSTSCKVATTTSGQAFLQWSSSLLAGGATSQGTVWFRAYLYFTAFPTASTSIFRAAGAANATCARVSVSTAGQIVVTGNSGTLFTITSSTIPLNTWFRLEAEVVGSASAGAVTVNRYDALNSTIVSATGSATGVNTFGVMTAWRFGTDVATAGIGPYWIDDCAVSNSGFTGPVPLGFTPVRIDGVGCVTMVAQNPANAAQFMAGCDVGGFFLSSNSGNSWSPTDTGLYDDTWRQVACVQWSAYEANTVYACVGNQSGGLMAYTPGGSAGWSFRNTTIQYAGNHSGITGDQSRSTGNLLAQAGTPASPLMYTATYNQGVYRSTSLRYGATWTNIGLSGGTFFGRSIAVDPNASGTVYVAMYGQGVYQATNANSATPANFTSLGNSRPFTEEIVAISVSGSTVLYAACGNDGVWSSSDSGATWHNLNAAGDAISTSSYWMTIDGYYNTSTGHTVLVAGCNNAVKLAGDTAYRELVGISVDSSGFATFTQFTSNSAAVNVATVPPEGRTWWQAPGSGSQAENFHEYLGGVGSFQPKVLIDKSNLPTSASSIYRAGSTGFFLSTNGGTAWQFSGNGLSFWPARMPQVDASNTLHVTCGSNDYVTFELLDGSAYNATTMIQSNAGPSNSDGYINVIDPVTGLTYLSDGKPKYQDAGGNIWARVPGALSGQNISLSGSQNPNGYVAYGMAAGRDPNNGNAPYLLAMVQQRSSGSGSAGAGMWKYSGYTINISNVTSPTSGGSWSHANSTIATSGGIPPGTKNEIIVDPSNGSNVYAFDQASGVWRSADAGSSWTHIWSITSNVNSCAWLAVNPLVANELWVSYTGGLYKVSNANTISSVSIGVNTTQVTAFPGSLPGGVCFAPDGTVYCISVGTSSQPSTQLYASINGGTSWYTADNGSVAAAASIPERLVYAPNGRIYIGTVGAKPIIYGYPLPPVDTGQALVTFTFSATATGTDTTGGTKFGAASATFSFGATATGSRAGQPAAQVSFAFAATTSGGASSAIVQQVQGISTFDYGLSTVEMTTTTGNTLVVLAGWDLSTQPTDAPMPAVYVSDSAGNLWDHVATSSAGVAGSRCSAWICPGASAIEWLSVSLTTFASSLGYVVLEITGMPNLYSLDISSAISASPASVLTLAPGVTTGLDYAFGVLATGGYTQPPAVTGNWQALTSVTAGSGPSDTNPVQVYPFFQTPSLGANLATTWTLQQAVPVSGIVFAVYSNVTPPITENPNWPVLKVEAGFGSVPGDPSQAPPSWTDITSRVLAPLGQNFITTDAGRQYELSQAEAGTMEIWLDNHDGAFTPSNTASPFWPNVAVETPIRVSAYWNGTWSALAYGWVERWPQEWPDLPQWGISKMIATDVISVMAAVTMNSALDSEILIDAPWVLINAAEQYLSFNNGLNGQLGSGTGIINGTLGTYSNANAQGLLAQNISRLNQRSGMYVNGNSAATAGNGPAIAETGLTTSLLGSANTGFGTSAISTTTAPTVPSAGPGIIYTDPNLPSPVTGPGVTVSFWVIIPGTVSFASLQPTVFTAYGPPSNYRSANASLSVQIQNQVSSNTLQVTLADGSTVTAPFNPAATAQMITLVLTSTALNIYVNGALEKTTGLSAAQTTAWSAVSLGCPTYAYQAGGLVTGLYTAFDLAIYPYPLPVQRIVSTFNTGLFGQQSVDATTRIAQILSWAGLGVPRAGRVTFEGITDGVLQGPAYNLAGTTAADAANQVAVNQAALVAAMPTGAVMFAHPWALFNQDPVCTFGDFPDPAAGEVPFLQASSFGFDDTFLDNSEQVTQQSGANNLFTVTVTDFGSEHAYFARSAAATTITTMSNLDAYSLANWLLAKYAQPALRVAGLVIDAAANPQAAFNVVLRLLQGQVATVNRRPAGGAEISQTCLIQKIGHAIGPGAWQVALQLSPYVPEDAVLQLDDPGSNAIGSNTLA